MLLQRIQLLVQFIQNLVDSLACSLNQYIPSVDSQINSIFQNINICGQSVQHRHEVVRNDTAVCEDLIEFIDNLTAQAVHCLCQLVQHGSQRNQLVPQGLDIGTNNGTSSDHGIQSDLNISNSRLHGSNVVQDFLCISVQLILHCSNFSDQLLQLVAFDLQIGQLFGIVLLAQLSLDLVQFSTQFSQLVVQLSSSNGIVVLQPLLSCIDMVTQFCQLVDQQLSIVIDQLLILLRQVNLTVLDIAFDEARLLQCQSSTGSDSQKHHLVLFQHILCLSDFAIGQTHQLIVGISQRSLDSTIVVIDEGLYSHLALSDSSPNGIQFLSLDASQSFSAVDDGIHRSLDAIDSDLQRSSGSLCILIGSLGLVVDILQLIHDGGHQLVDGVHCADDSLNVDLVKGQVINIVNCISQNQRCVVQHLQVSIQLLHTRLHISNGRQEAIDLCFDRRNSCLNFSDAFQISGDLGVQSGNGSIQSINGRLGFSNSSLQLSNLLLSAIIGAIGIVSAICIDSCLLATSQSLQLCLQIFQLFDQSITLSQHLVHNNILFGSQLLQLRIQLIGLACQFVVQDVQILIQIGNHVAPIVVQDYQNLISQVLKIPVYILSGRNVAQICHRVINDNHDLALLFLRQIGITHQHVVQVIHQSVGIQSLLASTHHIVQQQIDQCGKSNIGIVAPQACIPQLLNHILRIGDVVKILGNGSALTGATNDTADIGAALNIFQALHCVADLLKNFQLLLSRQGLDLSVYLVDNLLDSILHRSFFNHQNLHSSINDCKHLLSAQQCLAIFVLCSQILVELLHNLKFGIVFHNLGVCILELFIDSHEDFELLLSGQASILFFRYCKVCSMHTLKNHLVDKCNDFLNFIFLDTIADGPVQEVDN